MLIAHLLLFSSFSSSFFPTSFSLSNSSNGLVSFKTSAIRVLSLLMISVEASTLVLFVSLLIESLLLTNVLFVVVCSKNASISFFIICCSFDDLSATIKSVEISFSKPTLLLFDLYFDFLLAVDFLVLETTTISEFSLAKLSCLKLLFDFFFLL